jgi:hypothetical protein
LLGDLVTRLLCGLRGLLGDLLSSLLRGLARRLLRHLLCRLRCLQRSLLGWLHANLLSTLQGYLLCALLPNLLSGLCRLEGRLLGCVCGLTSYLLRRLLRDLLCRVMRDLLSDKLTDLCRLLHHLLNRLLRNRKRNGAGELAANPAQDRAELWCTETSAESHSYRLHQGWALNSSCQRIEVGVLATQNAARLRIAKGASKTSADRLTELAKNVSEPALRDVLLSRSVIGMRSTMPIRNLVWIS